jgi:starvation-inducible DNA-binding protein
MTDEVAERVRKIGGTTLHSISNIARLQRIPDNDADYVDAGDMLAEIREDHQALIASMREDHSLCDEQQDVSTGSKREEWVDQAEKRVWFLFETSRRADGSGHRLVGCRLFRLRTVDHGPTDVAARRRQAFPPSLVPKDGGLCYHERGHGCGEEQERGDQQFVDEQRFPL